MSKVKLWFQGDGKYFHRKAEYFETLLGVELAEREKNPEYHEDSLKHSRLLRSHVEKNKDQKHPDDILFDLLIKTDILNFEFAEKLHLFDIVTADCFSPNTPLEEAILWLCSTSELYFTVSKRIYHSRDCIEIYFDVADENYYWDLHRDLILQNVKR